jgi:hypothetical protein
MTVRQIYKQNQKKKERKKCEEKLLDRIRNFSENKRTRDREKRNENLPVFSL